jgi:DNA polymerase-3 subunit chi
MTDIAFHVNVPDTLPYACRLLRKAYRVGARVVVTGPPARLQQLDKLLWTFDALEFLPHVMVAPQAQADPVDERGEKQREATPIWLMERLTPEVPATAVLLNVGDEPVDGLAPFERLIEIVAAAEPQREAGRRRWKHYLAAGHAPRKHEVKE